jgi:hypothetical protein
MVARVDNGDMFAILFIAGLLALCILAAFFGVDSRPYEPNHHRPNL